MTALTQVVCVEYPLHVNFLVDTSCDAVLPLDHVVGKAVSICDTVYIENDHYDHLHHIDTKTKLKVDKKLPCYVLFIVSWYSAHHLNFESYYVEESKFKQLPANVVLQLRQYTSQLTEDFSPNLYKFVQTLLGEVDPAAPWFGLLRQSPLPRGSAITLVDMVDVCLECLEW